MVSARIKAEYSYRMARLKVDSELDEARINEKSSVLKIVVTARIILSDLVCH